MENKCSTETGNCQTRGSECAPKEDCCPVQMATDLWSCAFHQALKEAHVEVLKAKIHKAWGNKMDKTADAVLEAMEEVWQAKLVQGKAKKDLKEKIVRAMFEGKK